MTFDDWNQLPDHFFDSLTNIDIYSLPEWDRWKERINQVLSEMDYEDAMGCEFKDLLSLAGIGEGEIELAQKQQIEDKRIEKLNADF